MSTTHDLPESTTRPVDHQEAIATLEEAKLCLESSITLLQDYVRMSNDVSTEHTLVRNLQLYVDRSRGQTGYVLTIQDLIDAFRGDDEDEYVE